MTALIAEVEAVVDMAGHLELRLRQRTETLRVSAAFSHRS